MPVARDAPTAVNGSGTAPTVQHSRQGRAPAPPDDLRPRGVAGRAVDGSVVGVGLGSPAGRAERPRRPASRARDNACSPRLVTALRRRRLRAAGDSPGSTGVALAGGLLAPGGEGPPDYALGRGTARRGRPQRQAPSGSGGPQVPMAEAWGRDVLHGCGARRPPRAMSAANGAPPARGERSIGSRRDSPQALPGHDPSPACRGLARRIEQGRVPTPGPGRTNGCPNVKTLPATLGSVGGLIGPGQEARCPSVGRHARPPVWPVATWSSRSVRHRAAGSVRRPITTTHVVPTIFLPVWAVGEHPRAARAVSVSPSITSLARAPKGARGLSATISRATGAMPTPG